MLLGENKNRKTARSSFAGKAADKIKSANKKRAALGVAAIAVAAAAAVSIGASASLGQSVSGSADILQLSGFEYDKDDYKASSLMAENDNLVRTKVITAKSGNPDEQSTEVAEKPPVVSLNEKSITFKKLKESFVLVPSFSKEDAETKYKWTSADDKIAKVDKNGKVTPVKNGTVKITCTEENSGAKAECTVTVKTVLVKGIRLNPSSVTMNLKESKTIKSKITNDDAANKTLKWSSSDEKVVKVNNKGKITSVAAGTANVTCAATDGSGVKRTVKVTVNNVVALKELQLNYIDIQFCGLGCVEQLSVMSYLPEEATDTSVTWASTNENVAVVDQNGNVYPVDNGVCDIVATANDGSKVKASCPVTVSGVVNYVPVEPNYNVVIPQNININETANSIVEEADKYVGWLPYVWGGTDLTSGVDCSGFVCAIYEKFGINLWGIRTDLIYAGREVSLEEARAGDIIVYHGHVAIYDGNGGKIHAPTEGYMVTHDYGIGNYRSIRRVIE